MKRINLRKRFLSTIVLTIITTLILLVAVLAANVQKTETEFDIDDFMDLSEAQESAVAAHNLLYDSFLEAGGSEAVFPENYGGDFIDGNILHVCIVNLPAQDISSYCKLLDDYLDYVVFDNVAFSLQALLDGADATTELLLDEKVPVIYHNIDEVNNVIVIGIEESEFSRSLVKAQDMDGLYSTKQRTFELPVYFEISEPYHLTSTLIGGTALKGYTIVIQESNLFT